MDRVTECTSPAADETPRYVARLAQNEHEVLESLRLRFRIFAGELGAQLASAAAGVDADRYDEFCRHLVVLDRWSGRMVASTRLLTGAEAQLAGGFYSESEFDLSFLRGLPGRMMEVGRTCVDPEFRNGAVIATLWSELASMVARERVDYLFGCASIGLADGGAGAQAILDHIGSHYLSAPTQRVRPYQPFPRTASATPARPPRLPPLLKAYVSLGARACGEPYWDRDFGCIDVFMLLAVGELAPRYARRFLRATADGVAAHVAA